MTILVVQSCEYDRFQETVRLVRSRWPDAAVTSLVDEAWEAQARAWKESGTVMSYARRSGARPVFSDEMLAQIREQRFDLCAISYNDRFGIRFQGIRMVPIRTGIPVIVALNGRGKVSSYRRSAWCVSTAFACGVLRLVQAPARYVARMLDHLMIAALTMLAVGAAAVRAAGRRLSTRHVGARPQVSLRLVIFIPSLGLGGAQSALIDFLRRIDRRKCTVSVCTMDAPDKFFEPAVKQLGIPLFYLAAGLGIPYWKIIWSLLQCLRRERPDAAIGWLPWATVFTAVAGSLAGVPRIFMSLHSQSPARFPMERPAWQWPLDVVTARMVDKVIACSNACRDDYMVWGHIPSHKIVTIYNGVDLNRLQRPPESDIRAVRTSLRIDGGPLVGIVGRLSPEKDHRTFFEAMQAVREAVPAVSGIVVGDGLEKPQLMETAERTGLSGFVHFLGPRHDTLAVLASLDVLVLSSRTEGLPIVLLEGQALGVPVVTTDAGGARETVREGETGFIVPCGDSQRLAARMIQLLQDEPLRRSLGEKGRAHVFSRFSADRMAADILRLCHA